MKSGWIVCLAALAAVSLLLVTPCSAQEKEKPVNPMVQFETNVGDFIIELYPEKAPITVKNFLNYVDKKFYAGTTFHRVIPTFVIQGGGFTPDMMKKATAPAIENEATNGLKNLKYTLSMARTGEINSATSQFFINVKDNVPLDHRDTSPRGYGYAVFGKVVVGMDVIEKIKSVKTTTKGRYEDVPVKPVVIKAARRIEPGDVPPKKIEKAEKKAEKIEEKKTEKE